MSNSGPIDGSIDNIEIREDMGGLPYRNFMCLVQISIHKHYIENK